MASFVSTHCILPSGVGFVHDQDRSCGRTNTLHLQNAHKSPSSLSFLLSVRESRSDVVVVQSKGRSSFSQTTAVCHLTGSVTRAHGLRFAVRYKTTKTLAQKHTVCELWIVVGMVQLLRRLFGKPI
ncbi:hypothetical protein GmHk_14G041259 [Glycine max]|nr:hypothetical protein GmHk_14G041259 [Glycine max]